jgi:hypothetical protein
MIMRRPLVRRPVVPRNALTQPRTLDFTRYSVCRSLLKSFFGFGVLENTTSQTKIEQFFSKKSFKDINVIVCWKCRPSATTIFLRTVEHSSKYADVQVFQVFRCVRDPRHVFEKKVRNIE